MKELFSHLLPYRGKIAAAALLTALSSVSQLLLPTLMSTVVDDGVYQLDFSVILWCCGVMLLISLLGAGAAVWGRSFSADLRSHMFQKVMGISHRAFGKMDTGTLVTRSTQDITTLSWVAEMLSSSIISIPAMFLGGVILSFLVDPVLASIVLCAVPLVFVIVAVIGKRVAPLHEKSDEYIDRQNELMRQRLRGIRVIRAFRREPDEQQKIADATNIMANNIIRANVSMQSLNPIATFFLNARHMVYGLSHHSVCGLGPDGIRHLRRHRR